MRVTMAVLILCIIGIVVWFGTTMNAVELEKAACRAARDGDMTLYAARTKAGHILDCAGWK